MKSLRVCIDARITSGEAGGVEQFVIGLASGFSKLTDGFEEYSFLVYRDSKDWITPFLSGPCRTLEDIDTPQESTGRRFIKQKTPVVMKLLHSLDPRIFKRSKTQERSNGVIEKASVDMMHFSMQNAFLTEIPSIYHPHDLQHLHLPEAFSLRRRVLRDQMYRDFCSQASMVAVASTFVKNDLILHYGLPEEKVRVVSLAPVISSYSEPDEVDLANIRRKYSLPEHFIYYPAQTWPHKNHIGLLSALAILHERFGLRVDVVFSGKKDDHYIKISQRVAELGLKDHVYFLGFVNPMELHALYQLSRCVVIPTKFEAASFPLWEAFLMGVPAACSRVTSLPEQAGDAALLFDPSQPEEIACQIHKLWTDENLRAELVDKGRRNVSRFSWERTARAFRAHYRRIAGHHLSGEDMEIINSPGLF